MMTRVPLQNRGPIEQARLHAREADGPGVDRRMRGLATHGTRRLLMAYLLSNPGTHLRGIGQALDVSYGALTYHIHRLERHGCVVSRMDGQLKRYFPSARFADARRPPVASRPSLAGMHRIQRDLLSAVSATPGASQASLAQRLGLSRQALNYHVKRLEGAGILRKTREGRETLLYAIPGPGATPDASWAVSADVGV